MRQSFFLRSVAYIAITFLSLAPLSSYAADGTFWTYFERMVWTWPCASGYVLTWFDNSSWDYGKRTCISLSTMLWSILWANTAPAGQAVLGFTSTGGLRYGSVSWINAWSNIYYTGSHVGIGTFNPTAKLDVIGTAGNQTTLRVTASNWTSVATGWPAGWGGGIQTWDILAMSLKLNAWIVFSDWTIQTTAATWGVWNTACDREWKIRISDGNLQRCFY